MNPVQEDGGEKLDEIEEIPRKMANTRGFKNTLRTSKWGKAARVDEVGSDLLRADMEDN